MPYGETKKKKSMYDVAKGVAPIVKSTATPKETPKIQPEENWVSKLKKQVSALLRGAGKNQADESKIAHEKAVNRANGLFKGRTEQVESETVGRGNMSAEDFRKFKGKKK